MLRVQNLLQRKRASGILIRIACCGLLALTLTACVTNNPKKSAFRDSGDFTPASQFVGAESSFRYQLQPGDLVRIDFVKKMEFNRDLTIQPDGWISPPYIDALKASGLTLEELESKLETAYESVLRFSEINLDLLESQPLFVYVGGEVRAPNKQLYAERTTVQQAILQSGGTAKSAALKKVFVVRDVGNETPEYILFDFNSEEARGYRDIYLQPRDIVIVPKRNISRVSQFIDLYINEILPFSRSVNASYYYDEKRP